MGASCLQAAAVDSADRYVDAALVMGDVIIGQAIQGGGCVNEVRNVDTGRHGWWVTIVQPAALEVSSVRHEKTSME